jgi:hypothetical protein
MFYVLRVNSALAKLRIRPDDVEAEFGHFMQAAGKQSRSSPQEVALYIASRMPAAYRVGLDVETVRKWLRTGKINPDNPEVRETLNNLGLWSLM